MSPFSGLVRSNPRQSSLRPDDAPARTTHSYGPSVGFGQGTRHRDDSLLVPAIRDGHELAHELQHQPLLRRRHERTIPAHSLEEVANVDAQRLSIAVQAPRRNAIEPRLVLIRLLVADPDQLGQLVLGQPKHAPPVAHARANIPVSIVQKMAAGSSLRTRLRVHCGGLACESRSFWKREPRRSGACLQDRPESLLGYLCPIALPVSPQLEI